MKTNQPFSAGCTDSRRWETAVFKSAFISVICGVLLLCFSGCKTPHLEPGGVYAPTNSVGQVIYNDLGLALADASYKFAYESTRAVFKYERDNRAALWAISPAIKKSLDGLRPAVVSIDQRWALARKAYRANPTPAGLTTLQAILGESQRFMALVQSQLDPAAAKLTQPH